MNALDRRIPLVTDRPIIIFGADVTHSQPGGDSSPSIAAVAASMDWPEITKYRQQTHKEEIIQDLYKTYQDPQRGTVHGGMDRDLLRVFRRSTGLRPDRIIFYRDGIREGQFNHFFLFEMDAIRKVQSLTPTFATRRCLIFNFVAMLEFRAQAVQPTITCFVMRIISLLRPCKH